MGCRGPCFRHTDWLALLHSSHPEKPQKGHKWTELLQHTMYYSFCVSSHFVIIMGLKKLTIFLSVKTFLGNSIFEIIKVKRNTVGPHTSFSLIHNTFVYLLIKKLRKNAEKMYWQLSKSLTSVWTTALHSERKKYSVLNVSNFHKCMWSLAPLTEIVRVERLRLKRFPVVHLRILILWIICGICGPKGTSWGVCHVSHGGERIGHRQRLLRMSHFT